MKRVTTFVHDYCQNHLKPESIVCDLTCGNGNDTLFLAQHFKHVFAIDIQKAAIEHTRYKVRNYSNVSLIHASHADLDVLELPKMDAFIFNSGYLPKGDELIMTNAVSTLLAIEKAHALLKENGLLILTFYRKHPGGLEEYQSVYPNIPSTSFKELIQYAYDNDPLSPIVHIFKHG
jgi:methylase of polypeptide subunit release factors